MIYSMGASHDNEAFFAALIEEDSRVLNARAAELETEIAHIGEQLASLAREREKLELRHAIIESVRRLRRLEQGEAASVELGGSEPALARASHSVPTAVQAVLDADALRSWDAEEVHKELAQLGVASRLANVRVALQRLSRGGLISRVERGRYRATEVSESSSEPPVVEGAS